MRTLVILLLIAIAGVSGCRSAQAREASIAVDVADDQGRPLRAIPILVDDTAVATTNEAGHARAVVQALKGGRVRVKAQCPDTYREAEARHVVLSRAESQAARLTLRMTCAPKLRTLAVVVRAPGGEGLTLRADGAPVGKVASDGTAHVVLERAPGTSLRLSLDTTDAPKLIPQFPLRELHVSDRDEIVVFDQALALVQPTVRRTHRAVRKTLSAEVRHVPYAIGR